MNKEQARFHVKYNGAKKPQGVSTARWRAMKAQIEKQQQNERKAR